MIHTIAQRILLVPSHDPLSLFDMYLLKSILCPTDFSDASLDALRFAAFAAHASHGCLTLLYVDEFEKTAVGFFEESEQRREEHRQRAAAFAHERFDIIIKCLRLKPEHTRKVVRFGTAYKEIINEAEMSNYDAIALSTGGLGSSSPHLIGRTAERVVRLCRTPVITLRPQENPDHFKIRTVLCPTDFSEYSNYALPYAISLARKFNAKLIMLHVTGLEVQHPELLLDKFPDPHNYHEMADEITIERLVGKDVEPENTIVHIAEEEQVDLIVIGTHGARGMRRVQVGTTTEEVVRRVMMPVLSITHPVHKILFPRRFMEE
jgi:nucleotide-binding universal stress UspA family protein